MSFAFACPRCRTPLEPTEDGLCCPTDGTRYHQVDGVWHFLPPEREAALAPFIQDYETIRLAEGRTSDDPAYYRSLPYPPAGSPRAADWTFRSRGYELLLKCVIAPLVEGGKALDILDLGAGNGWLSHQLTLRGHRPLAVDLTTNAFDGLGARRHYDLPFEVAQAEFDALPLAGNEADLAIFNASLHYSTNYERTLAETLRVLRPDGVLVILDTPVYHQPESGQRMVEERAARFREQVGFASDALPSENFLTPDRLDALAAALDLRWEWNWTDPGWKRGLQQWRGQRRAGRETAQFPLLTARRSAAR